MDSYFNSVGERAAAAAPATTNGGAAVDDVDMIE
jgi:hypothetical protein